MKQFILLLAAMFVLEYAEAQHMNFGVKAGVNVASLSSSDSSTLIGFHFGGLAEFTVITEKLSLQPEVLFSTQGAKNDTGDLKLNYITVPVMFKYYFLDYFSVEAGPRVGFLISAKDGDLDVKDSFNAIDFGVDAGVNYDITTKIFAQLRYDYGVIEVQKGVPSGEDGSKNGVIQVSVGVKL
ncbi:porin family protein [Flavobacterium sp. GT3R68]|uniref:porin family protein n=1 Tax=Flavobacterium sp. GT3R68 TaxID=2594437 RepID=UPI000F888B7E|nr:porin family protein [Flavobacterium sp. GT3R68]RTY89663.1 PorT family protein [Flavobacterium sp. GSN2]TRW89451.1 PorT family protein [Flavobacterium sp. GT3R68]